MTGFDTEVQEQPSALAPPLEVEPAALAFEREAVPHIPALYRTALRLTHDQQAAEDLVQDTLERAFRGFERYERGSNMRAWLFKIMAYVSISAYRYRSIRPATTSLDATEEWSLYSQALSSGIQPDQVESLVLARLGESDVHAAIMQLAPEQCLAVMLADVEGFSYMEIAEILGIPRGTVMSRLHRGRRALQRALWEQARLAGIVPRGTQQ
jgi:RNA polymerase sigma-70 factor (ECF subfamily)